MWMNKWLIEGITITVSINAFVVALMLPNIYRSEIFPAPNDEGSLGGWFTLAAQRDGLAHRAGIDSYPDYADKKDEVAVTGGT